MRGGGPLALKTVPQGAAMRCYLATHADLGAISMAYSVDCSAARPSAQVEDAALGERLWEKSERIVARLTDADGAARPQGR